MRKCSPRTFPHGLRLLVDMLHIVLFQPEIPPNTGNVIRLCANTGARLHLIHPLGFSWDNKRLRRAGLDYHEWAEVQQHSSLSACLRDAPISRLFATSVRGTKMYTDIHYLDGDALLFGAETNGLPQDILDNLPPAHILRIPMMSHSRCLNLSNAVSVILFEAWRQLGFSGGS